MKTINVIKYRDIDDGIYGDVLSHCKNPVINESRFTNVHETSHFISSELRKGRKNQNAFYLLDGKAVILDNPKITIDQISKYVPANLRGSRYNLYLINQQKYWNNYPLYILEEWNCYILGGMCAVEDFNNNKKVERTDAVAGMFEFIIYCIALTMCVKDKDKEYWHNNFQFTDFISNRINASLVFFGTGRQIPSFHSNKSDILYNTYKTTDEGRLFQQFIDKNFLDIENINWGFKEYL